MGLDAFVPCRCWRDGRLSTPPPVDPPLIRMDEEDVRYIVNPLITVCRAAVDTDARVHWC